MNKEKNNKTVFIIIGFLSTLVILLSTFLILILNSNNSNSVFDKNVSKVVEVKATTDEFGISYGSGTVINENLNILTNSHIISYTKGNEYFYFEKIEVRFTYQEDFRPASIVENNKDQDLALLKIDNIEGLKQKYFEVKDYSYKVGEEVFAIGNSSNNGIAITSGIITMPSFDFTYNDTTRNVIQVDINVSSGNSGGPLVSKKGNLLGIITFKLKDDSGQVIEGFGYALSYIEISKFL